MSEHGEYGPVDVAYQAAVTRGDTPQATLLEKALEATRTSPRPGPHDWAAVAAWYANRNLRVFPLQAGKKRPLFGSHGVTDATTDPSLIAQWFSNRPPLNIGVATGDRFDVIDIDGPEGSAAFARMIETTGSDWLAIQGVTATPRGYHMWVPAVPGARNGTGMSGNGLDYRGEGGYVVVPPSQVDGTVYRWLLPIIA